MSKAKVLLAGLALVALGACARPDVVTRAADGEAGLLSEGGGEVLMLPSYRVSEVRVSVPETLAVSEKNSYKPRADIVWRGDPYGNRYQQVAAVVKAGVEAGVEALDGTREVVLEIEVKRFHALTEKARYTVGGTHDIDFLMTVLDAETGVVLEPPRLFDTEFAALGGLAAMAADARGETQKVRIIAYLKNLIYTDLTTPREIPVQTPAAQQLAQAPDL